MYVQMVKRCWYCDRPLNLLKRFRGDDFCSADHEQMFLLHQNQVAMERMSQLDSPPQFPDRARPPVPRDLSETATMEVPLAEDLADPPPLGTLIAQLRPWAKSALAVPQDTASFYTFSTAARIPHLRLQDPELEAAITLLPLPPRPCTPNVRSVSGWSSESFTMRPRYPISGDPHFDVWDGVEIPPFATWAPGLAGNPAPGRNPVPCQIADPISSSDAPLQFLPAIPTHLEYPALPGANAAPHVGMIAQAGTAPDAVHIRPTRVAPGVRSGLPCGVGPAASLSLFRLEADLARPARAGRLPKTAADPISPARQTLLPPAWLPGQPNGTVTLRASGSQRSLVPEPQAGELPKTASANPISPPHRHLLPRALLHQEPDRSFAPARNSKRTLPHARPGEPSTKSTSDPIVPSGRILFPPVLITQEGMRLFAMERDSQETLPQARPGEPFKESLAAPISPGRQILLSPYLPFSASEQVYSLGLSSPLGTFPGVQPGEPSGSPAASPIGFQHRILLPPAVPAPEVRRTIRPHAKSLQIALPESRHGRAPRKLPMKPISQVQQVWLPPALSAPKLERTLDAALTNATIADTLAPMSSPIENLSGYAPLFSVLLARAPNLGPPVVGSVQLRRTPGRSGTPQVLRTAPIDRNGCEIQHVAAAPLPIRAIGPAVQAIGWSRSATSPARLRRAFLHSGLPIKRQGGRISGTTSSLGSFYHSIQTVLPGSVGIGSLQIGSAKPAAVALRPRNPRLASSPKSTACETSAIVPDLRLLRVNAAITGTALHASVAFGSLDVKVRCARWRKAWDVLPVPPALAPRLLRVTPACDESRLRGFPALRPGLPSLHTGFRSHPGELTSGGPARRSPVSLLATPGPLCQCSPSLMPLPVGRYSLSTARAGRGMFFHPVKLSVLERTVIELAGPPEIEIRRDPMFPASAPLASTLQYSNTTLRNPLFESASKLASLAPVRVPPASLVVAPGHPKLMWQ